MSTIADVAYETYYLAQRTLRRFFRVPGNWIPIVFFPLTQLLLFSQLYKDIVQLPQFGSESNYLAYLAPGQVAFTAFMAVSWAGYGLVIEYRTGYLDKLRASPIHRWSILAAEMIPTFVQSAAMAAIVLVIAVLLGATIVTGVLGFLMVLVLAGSFGIAFAGTSFIPALLTKSEQATNSFSLILFPVMFMSTAFVPAALMPAWMQVINQWNPITKVIEAMRTVMVVGFEWGPIGSAFAALGILLVVLQIITMWAFYRLAR